MRPAWLGLLVIVAACGREVPPEKVAVEYARALYAQDRARAYRLLSAQDREGKTEAMFVAEGDAPTGNALDLTRHLASFIEIVSVGKMLTGDRAEVKLTLRLPHANAPEVAGLAQDWDVAALNALSEADAERVRTGLDQLHRAGRLPMLEGDETFELVREPSGWRLVLLPAGTIRVRFRTRSPEELPVRVAPAEQDLVVRPGEPFRMRVSLTNQSGQQLSMRVSHEIEPKVAASSVVFVQCPLLLPVQLPPGDTREYSITLVIAGGVPDRTEGVQVTFTFRTARSPGIREWADSDTG